MAIEVTCRRCGMDFRVKDAAAGKRIRCRECEAPIKVPEPADDWDEDFDDDEDEFDEPPRRSRRRSAPSRPKKRRRSKSRKSGFPVAKVAIALAILIGLGVTVFAGVWIARRFSRTDEWHSFQPPGGEFVVEFPLEPEPVAGTVSTRKSGFLIARSQGCSYGIKWDDIGQKMDAETTQRALDAGRDRYLANYPKARLVEERSIMLDDHIGRETRFKQPPMTVVMRGYVVEDRIFVLKCDYPGEAEEAQVNRFMESFKIDTENHQRDD